MMMMIIIIIILSKYRPTLCRSAVVIRTTRFHTKNRRFAQIFYSSFSCCGQIMHISSNFACFCNESKSWFFEKLVMFTFLT